MTGSLPTEADALSQDAADPLLRQRQMLLDFAVAHSPAIFYVAELESDRPSKFISSNVESITGHPAAAFLDEAGYGRRFVHPDDLEGYIEKRRALRHAGSLSHEYRFRTMDGEWLWFRDEVRLVEGGGGEAPEIVGCMLDVTQEKAAEAERERLARRFHDAVESLQNGFSVTDAEGRLVACNSALGRNFHFDPKDLIGQPRRALVQRTIKQMHRFDGELVGDGEEWIERVSRGILGASQRPVELELKSGRWVLVTGHATSEGGQVTVGTDITRLKEAEAELRRSERSFRSMVEDNPLPIWLVDLGSAEILYASPAAAELLGYDWPFDARTRTTDFFFEHSERDRLVGLLRGRRTEKLNLETRFRRADGGEIWVGLHTRFVEYQGREAAITGIVDLTERQRRETELRQAQEILEDAIGALSDGFILYDADDRLVLCNQQYKNFNHLAADLFVPGARWIDITRERARRGQFPEALPDIEAWLSARAAEHGRLATEAFPTAAGRWYEHSHRRTRQGGVVITWRDITEQRERQDALERAHETLEDAVESLSEGFALYDADDRLVLCNRYYRDIHRTCADILRPGMRFEDLVWTGLARGEYVATREQADKWAADYAEMRAAGGSIIDFEYEVKSGRWYTYSSQPTRRGGRVATVIDITQRKKMERALRESEAVVRQILEASPVTLTMARASDGQILYESPVAERVFKYDAALGYGTTVERFPSDEARTEFLARLRAEGAVDGVEMEMRRSDGSKVPVALSARLIKYMDEEVTISTVFDLTERTAMEAEMARQREILHQSEKMSALGQLLASVAHELNNPLSVVVGQALLLKETAADKAIAARAERIGNAADRCARIVRTFLAMARQQPTESLPVNPNELLESALEVAAYALRASGVEVSLRLARDLPTVRADPDQLTQVFTNLLVNAEQALRDAPGPRKLWLASRLNRQGDAVIVKIKDNGPGVPQEISRRIFEPFFTTKEVGTGTGIGLSICHRILEAHGGRIKLESTPGGGATFVVRLPVLRGEDTCAADAAQPAAPEGSLAILVVDDEPEVAELIYEILRRDGHRVDVASSGQTAMTRLQRQAYDLVLSDMRMPGLDGPGLYLRLKRERPVLAERIAFITGDTLSPDIKAFLTRSGRPYIEKPITPADVRSLVARMVQARAG